MNKISDQHINMLDTEMLGKGDNRIPYYIEIDGKLRLKSFKSSEDIITKTCPCSIH